MDFRLGYVDTLFEDIVYKQIDCPLLDLYYQQFVELGFYYEHVKKYFDVFGEANVKVILNEDLKDHMRQVFIEVCDFLQIGSNVKQDFNREYNVYRNPRNSLVKFLYSVKTNRQIANAIIPTSLVDMIKDILLVRDKKPSLCQKTKSYLDLLFRENIYQTGELIGRNLSHWCDE